ncbi:EGF domain-specific O-linked N-acetylglucosamine transferase isoform X1 [Schistocerca americana]|uniref:EGF domain-specific O-linked N-acetylglucosamine transferase isoform X1 n=1 Tax=Schistocerca americana TaxID=7009 RepID=UPI001F502250|nr:EGF domain-specific O-linked N-acetylglucosamine transferase isoform X1 [Schistocerca americana]XP_049951468.1 EGF domain-specific O-linked N-acetylglucosamine transferase isoform X1 [Schistocerca serialis cubense]
MTSWESVYIQHCFIISVVIRASVTYNFSNINLPDEHIPYYFSSFNDIAEKCRTSDQCPYKEYLDVKACWGYEQGCKLQESYSMPLCPGDHRGWVKSKQDQLQTFYTQGDFGYVRQQLEEMMVMCEPLFKEDSSLECSKHLRFCRGRNLMINLTDLASRSEPLRYKMDVLKPGQIGGYCRLHNERLQAECDHISPLQSWGPEIRYFTELPRRPITDDDCDVVIEKPTFIMKIDATVNMYHHFCDFFNLYASLHINSSHPSAFSTDVHILIWESFTYQSSFKSVWEAFTSNPLWDLKTFRGEKVCFRNVVFPLLPRMIFGLFYNTPIIWGCEKSGLFHAFSKHILHRLHIPQYKRNDSKIHVTLLSRDTAYRRILNEDELIYHLKLNPEYEVKKVVYNRQMDFKKQLEHTHNSDIFIGIHGAGLTHLLFLPDWAVVFELYNCEDESCYLDLARLRGVKYITWQDKTKLHQQDEGHHPEGGAHAKFTNYGFDVTEFLRLVEIGAKHVKHHQEFKKFHLRGHDEL